MAPVAEFTPRLSSVPIMETESESEFPFLAPDPVLSFRAMSNANLDNPTPQFGTAEYR
jgi:hypothetical protein